MDLLLPMALMGVGLLLVIAEVIFPSMGVLSVLAAGSIIGAVVLAFGVSSSTGAAFLAATAVLVPGVILFGFKILPKSPMAKYLVAEGFSFEDGDVSDDRDSKLLGREGEVVSPLRPAGMARLDGRRVDVVSRGEMIDVGARVRVIDLTGNRVVVARAPEPEQTAE